MSEDQEFDFTGGARLSQAIQSDLLRWHEHLSALGDSQVAMHPAQFRVLVARCVQAVAGARRSALIAVEAAAELVERDQADLAAAALNCIADNLRDAAPTGQIQ